MKILFVVNVDWFFVSHRIPIAIEAIKRGYEVHIATSITSKYDYLQSVGLYVHPIDFERSGMNPVQAIIDVKKICDVIRKVNPDILHLVTIKPVLLGGIAARLEKTGTLVLAVSGLGFAFTEAGIKAVLLRTLIKFLYGLVFRHPNLCVIFQNQHDKKTLTKATGLNDSNTRLIRGSGVDLSAYSCRPLPEGRPVVMFAARLLLDKGVREFVESARILKKSDPLSSEAARFVLVGEPDPENPNSLSSSELQDWITEGIIEYWGYRSDMPNVLGQAHVVVLPSYYGEGLPKVLIEAAACGRAVVTTDHPGCRDAILPGQTGLLVPIKDGPALASAIASMINDRGRSASFGAAGRKLAEESFDVRQVVEDHFDIYEKLLRNANA
jgi:glycosyltransferase involved in cell wall biosynthesis